MKDGIPSARPIDSSQLPAAEQAAPSKKKSEFLDYTIQGTDIQFVEIDLKPGESVLGEGITMMYYDKGIEMKVRANTTANSSGSIISKILGIGKAVMKGEKIFMMNFTNKIDKVQKVAFSAQYPGKIIPLNLERYGGKLFCQKNSFLCASKGIHVSTATPRELGGNIFNSGLVMEKLEGIGIVFIYLGGAVTEKTLEKGETIHVSTGTEAIMQSTVDYKSKIIRNVGVTGEGHKLSQLTGPGAIWLQSLPFARVQENIAAYTRDMLGIKPKRSIFKK